MEDDNAVPDAQKATLNAAKMLIQSTAAIEGKGIRNSGHVENNLRIVQTYNVPEVQAAPYMHYLE